MRSRRTAGSRTIGSCARRRRLERRRRGLPRDRARAGATRRRRAASAQPVGRRVGPRDDQRATTGQPIQQLDAVRLRRQPPRGRGRHNPGSGLRPAVVPSRRRRHHGRRRRLVDPVLSAHQHTAPRPLGQRDEPNDRGPRAGRRVPAEAKQRPAGGRSVGRESSGAKRVRIERLDRLGRWRFARTVRLTQGLPTGGSPGSGTSGSHATFRPRLPKGTQLRAVMPPAQARPCYAAGVSDDSSPVTDEAVELAARLAGERRDGRARQARGGEARARRADRGGHVLLEDVPGTAKTVLARAIAGLDRGRDDHADPVHAGPPADRRHGAFGLRPEGARVRVPAGPDLRERRARRRDQPRDAEDAVGAARSDGRAAGHCRRRDASCRIRSS